MNLYETRISLSPGFADVIERGIDPLAIVVHAMMKHIEHDRDTGRTEQRNTICDRVISVVVLNDKPPSNGWFKTRVPFFKTLHAQSLVFVYAADVYLDLCGRIELHEVEYLGMISEFFQTPVQNRSVDRIQQGELVRMHGNAHIVFFDVSANAGECNPEIPLPWKLVHGMRRERNQV